MELQLTRLLPGEKLTQARIFDMRHDEELAVTCRTAAEWQTAQRVAYLARANAARSDGYSYRVESSATAMTVTVTLQKSPPP